MKIVIKEDFSETPGSRYIYEGPFSGQDFRDRILIQKYNEAIELHEKLEIDFDGCFGFATSFLEESFGGLVREYKKSADEILNNIIIISEDDNTIPRLVKKYILDAESNTNK